ncbi:hypothetical protein [Allopontixanthobacter sediminis]|uniref:Uncharacterized protein n=1 Tax=Allopontixanthobacter sediminis TaxID=1689985 RepID=A0A845AYS0_9SPHN|nr:hypothetical protein [Allopontixanthobacter sediminis]MXP43068.1 hypothetical protein [Allopontixanthobacter sediminis]
MASAIGFRGYLITAHRRGDPALIPVNSSDFRQSPDSFTTNFINRWSNVVTDDERERSWYFEERENGGAGDSKGFVHYGTFGFESNLVDNATKMQNYRRQVSDVEEIPLFYEFWFPEGGRVGFVGFQSFQGRSCVTIVMERFKSEFEAANPDFLLRYQKLMPTDVRGGAYNRAPVKRLRLIKRGASPDVTDRYLGGNAPEKVDFEVSIKARRNGSLGSFRDVSNSIGKNDRGVILHDGIEFNEAVADIKVGSKTRPVTVFGSDTFAGVIDITDDIERGRDGHPTFDSLSNISDDILSDFNEMIVGKSDEI